MKIKLLNDMKKTYLSPLMEEVSVATENIIAMSFNKDENENVNTNTPGGQLGNTNRGEWGNLWSK